MSDENMASDINTAISSGGYVMVPESAVDGSGADAIYVYMTYNGQTGTQSWKISGGLNGGMLIFVGFLLIFFAIALILLVGGVTMPVIIWLVAPLLVSGLAFIGGGISLLLGNISLCKRFISITLGGFLFTIGKMIPLLATFSISTILSQLLFNYPNKLCDVPEK